MLKEESSTESHAKYSYFQGKLKTCDKQLPSIDCKETEILNLKQQIQNLKLVISELTIKDKKQ